MAVNEWGNVNEDLMRMKYKETSPKFNHIRDILNSLHEDLLEEWFKDEDGEYSFEAFEKTLQFQIGDFKRRLLEDVNILCLDITNSYSKALVHNHELKELNQLSEDYKVEMYWFQYNAQVAIRQIGTLEDYLYRYINVFNGYEIKQDINFKNTVKAKLRNNEKKEVVKELEFGIDKLKGYRDDITHNFNVFRNREAYKEKLESGIDAIKVSDASINSPEQFIEDFEGIIEQIVGKYENVFRLNRQ
ncbi:hypothetical protein AB6E71_08675 [Staphylococcus arlettae]|uniref:hypothetical protein n=1 Tax=Staphylococcus arlettae TaxID=29378 RepID=UPI0034DD7B3D